MAIIISIFSKLPNKKSFLTKLSFNKDFITDKMEVLQFYKKARYILIVGRVGLAQLAVL